MFVAGILGTRPFCRPIGSFYATAMTYTAAGPITAAATNFVRLAFSEPVSGMSIDQFNVTLTPAPDTAFAAPAIAQVHNIGYIVTFFYIQSVDHQHLPIMRL